MRGKKALGSFYLNYEPGIGLLLCFRCVALLYGWLVWEQREIYFDLLQKAQVWLTHKTFTTKLAPVRGIFGVVIIGQALCKRLTKVHLAEYLSEVQVCDATGDAMKYDSW